MGSSGGIAYRPEIDGLRAIAVSMVVLFHLGTPLLNGGYVGVDVFFVISGYLITSLIRREIVGGAFSFKRFYLRRIRRLTPALLSMVIATTGLAWWLLFPEDLHSFATSLALQPFSLQNIAFLVDGEYFRGADSKPLLHTWSLAVEEQFYLFWPLLLVAYSRLAAKRGRAVLFLATALIASFGLNIALMRISPKASFFLLPPRAWELGAGALVALLEERGAFAHLDRRWRAAACGFGLLMIAGAAAGPFPTTSFPGFAALLPVAGTVLCLIATCGEPHRLSGILSNRAGVHVGLISYPLYLWHWPVLVLWQYNQPHRHRLSDALFVLIASVVLAELTYRFVEKPVRQRRKLSRDSSLLGAAIAAALLVVAAGQHIRWTDGAAYRYAGIARPLLTASFHARSDRCGTLFRVLHPLEQVCPLTQQARGRQVLVWGNSHADMWSAMLAELAREKGATLYLNARNCRATVDSTFCGRHVQRAILDFAKAHRITDVVLAASWYGHYVTDQVFEAELEHVVGELNKQPLRVWLVIDTPSGKELNPLNAFQIAPANPRFGSVPANEQHARRLRERALFEILASRYPTVHILDPSSTFCNAEHCSAGEGETLWYRDGNHLNDIGARKAKSHFIAVFSD